MIRYILNDTIYVDFDFIKNMVGKHKSTVHFKLKRFLKDNEVEILSYNGKFLFEHKAISGFIQTELKNN